MPQKDKNAFSQFFKEDAEIVRNITHAESSPELTQKVGTVKSEIIPKISRSKDVKKEEEIKAYWRILRSFFRGGHDSNGISKDLVPALLAPLYTNSLVGSDFPVWIADENFDGQGEFCLSLKEIIIDLLEQIGPKKEDAHILKENVERIIHLANDQLSDHLPQSAPDVLDKALIQLEKLLDVTGDEALPFKNTLEKLRALFPNNGVLLPYTSNTSLHLLESAILDTLGRARQQLKQDIRQLTGRLKDTLSVELDKGPYRNDPDKLHDSMDFADSMVDFDELSAILPGDGSESMDAARIQRITKVIDDLEETAVLLDQQCLLFVDELLYDTKNIDWANILGTTNLTVYKTGNGCASLDSAFDHHIATWTKLFCAKRIGDLELKNSYQDEIHGEFFQHFNWQGFSAEELNNCPYFILIADDIQLFETEFRKLSSMLSANIPIKVVAVKRDDFVGNGQSDLHNTGSAWHANTELGALMLSYKNIYITQSTSITPKHLFSKFKEGLSAFAPAFFYLLNIDRAIHEDSYLWTSACVESRDFPGFTFRGMLGSRWGSRFEMENNPQIDQDWPLHELTVLNEKNEKNTLTIPFTFTDWAALNPSYSSLFMPVEACFWKDDLIPLTEYMKYSVEENMGKIPYIWMMDAANELHKIAVSWSMVIATQERLDFWRFLQENSGINNYHVALAVEKAKEEMQEQHRLDIEAIKEDQKLEIQKIREEEAGVVMENLTSALLDLDASNMFVQGSIRPATPITESDHENNQEEDQEGAITEKEVVEENILSDDPYIDTALCTACNECTEINGDLFKYNADKLAYVADPKAGTFSDLVEAAEICPVSIIHPGSPLNPNEPGLDGLIERAKKFN